MTRTIALLLASVAFLPAIAGAAGSLEEIEVGQDQVELKLSGPSQPKAFLAKDPARLVVDLPGIELPEASTTLEGMGERLRQVRVGQFQTSPQPIARVVLELTAPVGYTIRTSGSDVLIRLGPAPVDPLKAAPPAADVALLGIETGPDRAVLRLTGICGYRAYAAADRPTIRLDLLGVVFPKSLPAIAGQGQFLKQITAIGFLRGGQPETRLILKLNEKASFRLDREGNDLVLTLGG